jgi:hypothetical protein
LKECVQVLGSIYCMVPTLQKDAWHTLSILCRSHNGQAVVRIFMDVLKEASNDSDKKREEIRDVRGALLILLKLVTKSTEKGYPAIPYSLLLEGMANVVNTTSAWKVQFDLLCLTNALMEDSQEKVHPIIVDEDWAALLDIAATCANASASNQLTQDQMKAPTSREISESSSMMIGEEVKKLVDRLEQLLTAQPGQLLQRHDCIAFFARIHKVIPDSAASLVLDYYKEFRCCFPSDIQWEANLRLVLDAMFANRVRSTQLRLQALQTVTEAYDMVELISDQAEPDFVPHLVKGLLADVSEETNIEVLQEIISFTAGLAVTAAYPLFSNIIDIFKTIVTNDRISSAIPTPVLQSTTTATYSEQFNISSQSPSNVVAKSSVQIFLHVMHADVAKATRLFHLLVWIAGTNSIPTDARLTAMQLLFRLRADWANRVFVIHYTESFTLASLLCRTAASMAKKQADDAAQLSRTARAEASTTGRVTRGVSLGQDQAPERGSSAGSGSNPKTGSRYRQLWSASEADPFPDVTSQTASPVLYSQLPAGTSELDGDSTVDRSLPAGRWLEAIVNLFQHGCDWEVFSFVLVHLPSQLSNHGIFRAAVPQIQELRKTLCDQIRLSTFQEPPSATGLRRADVVICLFHTLTMIMSYHQYFQKAEEDDIVSAFVRGINSWERSARCCIHALSICCYELPMSISKALVNVLQRMSQVVTQPPVAMHILEFLVCLSRLPSLYVNFREEEYRIVFGIAFRYLQYVRDKKQSLRLSSNSSDPATHLTMALSTGGSNTGPNAADDLPQYVYALAYHVITFWFLALKLPDRANHVGWIAKNLFTDVDGSEVTDEQAQTTIDFMQRVAYADVRESAMDPLFTAERFGRILERRWLIGNSIVTIQQAIASGWAQITKRQPSGTSSYMVREMFTTPLAHQEHTAIDSSRGDESFQENVVLPSHLLVQLLSSMPQCTELARPIPLPDDDAINRAIRLFDHSSTVDGHKAGIIYIGEGQTKEVEILANSSGSTDYVEFLNGLGTLTRLKGATFNTQGLDRQYDTDGKYTFCWRDRTSEIVFHVTTQMPTDLERDPQCTMKKRHIGNDFINIIFNDSGLPFRFDTFPSDFNFVNIVITPESRASFVATRQRTPLDVRESFYKVQVMSKPGFPEISPASETKIVSLDALPDFIRLLALNASYFSGVWANREGGEHISPWRHRLREIARLREKYGSKTMPNGSSPSSPGSMAVGGPAPMSPPVQADTSRPSSAVRDSFSSSLRRSSVATFFSTNSEANPQSHRSSMLTAATAATSDITETMHPNCQDSFVEKIDFSKWA